MFEDVARAYGGHRHKRDDEPGMRPPLTLIGREQHGQHRRLADSNRGYDNDRSVVEQHGPCCWRAVLSTARTSRFATCR